MDADVTPHRLDLVPFFDAFLSYSSADHQVAEGLATRLEQDGFDVFLDSWFIQPGHHVPKILLAALRKSRKVVALMTPNYFRGPWTELELNWNFVETYLSQPGDDSPLIPMTMQACEIPKELMALRRLDSVGDASETAYAELAKALRQIRKFSISSYFLPSWTEASYLATFIMRKLDLFFKFPERRLSDFAAVYQELVQNAYTHVTETTNRVEVSITAFTERVDLQVRDGGKGFDLDLQLRLAREQLARDPGALTGRGLVLVAGLCDSLSNAKEGGHVVTVVWYRDLIEKVHDIALILTRPERPTGLPLFVSFVDPDARYAYLDVRVGRIDHDNAQVFSQFLEGSFQGPALERALLDLSSVHYIGSAGLRPLLLFARRAKQSNRSIAVVVVQSLLKEIFEISHFTLLFKIVWSRQEGLEYLLGPGNQPSST